VAPCSAEVGPTVWVRMLLFAEVILEEEKVKALYVFETLCMDDLSRKKQTNRATSNFELLQLTHDM
jgi:hypothetical protein